MNILFLAAEAEPFIKVGGLADVAGSLPPAIQQISDNHIDIRVVIPFHGALKRQSLAMHFITHVQLRHYPQPVEGEIYQLENTEVPTYLISGSPLSPEAPVYTSDSSVDGIKYTFFSLAALEFCKNINWRPDIIHANDWHTAPALYALDVFKDAFFATTGKIITIHNLPYLGHGAADALGVFGLPPATNSNLPVWAQQLPLPVGLHAADKIVAVSPTYAKEILTPDFGAGLDGYLKTRAADICGILNGIDYQLWDPMNDPAISYPYDVNHLAEKRINKSKIFQDFNLPFPESTFLIGMITRMDYQKGVDLALNALDSISNQPWAAFILGTGSPVLEKAVSQLEQKLTHKVKAVIRFDPSLSRKIYAAADLLLIPSRYEPCGLTQMIAMKYGTLPLGRATGGLKDTITDNHDPAKSCGFLFDKADSNELAQTILRAMSVYQDEDAWQTMQINAMQQDFSWSRSAIKYYNLYKEIQARYQPQLTIPRSNL
ncbi:MAG: glycogen synthase [Anaerolineales bacterium]